MRTALLLATSTLLAEFTPEQLKEDLRIARQALEEAHPGAFRYTSKAQFARGFDQAAARLTRPMSAVEFFRVLAHAVALVKCGHTGIGPPEDLQKQIRELPLLPFDIEILDGRVYVLRDLTSTNISGAEILAINGVPAKRLVARFELATMGDANIAVGRHGRLSRGGFVRALWLHAGFDPPFRVTYRLAGSTKTAEFTGIPSAKRTPASDPSASKPVATLEFPGDGVAVLTIRSFGGFADRDRKVPLSDFLTRSFGEIREKGSRALILDLRGNGGGRDELGKQLLAHLLDREFKYYEDLVVNARSFSFSKYLESPFEIPEAEARRRPDGRFDSLGHPNLGMQKPAEPGFRGKVIALADRYSFSATGEFLTSFHRERRGMIAGEETGAAYAGNNSGMGVAVVLPNTKFRVYIPVVGYFLPMASSAEPDRGVMPDVPVKLAIGDRLAGRDPVMERARELAKAK